MKKIDIAIIGAGSAGLSARREVAKKTQNYLVFDGGKLGTTCARVGCMPSKVLIQSANDFHRRKKFSEQGILGEQNLSVEIPKVMKHVRVLRDRFVRSVESSIEEWEKDKLIRQYVTFTGTHTLKTQSGEVYEFNKVIIAVGTSPLAPKILTEYEDYLLSTDNFFEQVDLPKKMAVLGTGVIGLELGQAINRLGIETLIIGRRRRVSGIQNDSINEYACRTFESEINLNFTGLIKVKEKSDQLILTLGDGSEHSVDKVLLANGRDSNLSKLKFHDIFEGGSTLKKTTFQSQKFSHVFIAGDATGEKQILHEASDEGKIAGLNAVSSCAREFQTRTPLGITFTDPGIAFCGMPIDELVKEKIDYVEGAVSFEGQGRSIIKLKEVGQLRIYARKTDGLILGAEIFGPSAEHLAHLIAWSVQSKHTVFTMLEMPFYHPVVEEGLRTALRNAREKLEILPPELELSEKNILKDE